ncbi:MAG: hypothetical protein QM811_03550 [Pirellulales bacterium]
MPLWHSGELKIVPWGCRSGILPRTGTIWQRTVDAGQWVGADDVWVPAGAGVQRGIWYPIKQGVRAILATKGSTSAAYLIVRESTYYYRIMTRSVVMPVLVDEII